MQRIALGIIVLALGCHSGPPELKVTCHGMAGFETSQFSELKLTALKTGDEFAACFNDDTLSLYYKGQAPAAAQQRVVALLASRGFHEAPGSPGPKTMEGTAGISPDLRELPPVAYSKDGNEIRVSVFQYLQNAGKPVIVELRLTHH